MLDHRRLRIALTFGPHQLATCLANSVPASTYLSSRELRRWEALANRTAGLLMRASGGAMPIAIQRTLGVRRSRGRVDFVAGDA
jgi:hypothetical protein